MINVKTLKDKIKQLEDRLNRDELHIIFDEYNDPEKAVKEYEAKHKIKIPPGCKPIIISFV